MTAHFNEKDLYHPIKSFFEAQGYIVKGEVKGCDMALVKGDEVVIVELKKNFNVTLLYQAIDRKKISNKVFAAIPRHIFARNKAYILDILEGLKVGLIIVALDSPSLNVEVLLFPASEKTRNNRKSRELLAEFNGRTFDGNIGGSRSTKLLTAHRERVLHIAVALEKMGPSKPAQLVKKCGCYKASGQTLRRNFYGWFINTKKGIYDLSDEGKAALNDPAFYQIAEFYRKKVDEYLQSQDIKSS